MCVFQPTVFCCCKGHAFSFFKVSNFFSDVSVDEKDEVSISHAAEKIAQAFGFKGDLVYDTTMADGQFKKTASNAKLRKLNPDFVFTPFEVAVQETVEWYKENHNIARL